MRPPRAFPFEKLGFAPSVSVRPVPFLHADLSREVMITSGACHALLDCVCWLPGDGAQEQGSGPVVVEGGAFWMTRDECLPPLPGCSGPVFPNPAEAHLLRGGCGVQRQRARPPGQAAAGCERCVAALSQPARPHQGLCELRLHRHRDERTQPCGPSAWGCTV